MNNTYSKINKYKLQKYKEWVNMIKLHKKVVSGVLVGLAVFGGVFQYKGIAAQAEVKVLQQEERNLSSKQKRDLVLERQIEHYMVLSGKYKILNSFNGQSFYSLGVRDLNDFIRNEYRLKKGNNYIIYVGSAYIYMRVK